MYKIFIHLSTNNKIEKYLYLVKLARASDFV